MMVNFSISSQECSQEGSRVYGVWVGGGGG
jgi:hypothetical protein